MVLFDDEGSVWSITDAHAELEASESLVGHRPEGEQMSCPGIDPPYEGMLPMAGGDVIPLGSNGMLFPGAFLGL